MRLRSSAACLVISFGIAALGCSDDGITSSGDRTGATGGATALAPERSGSPGGSGNRAEREPAARATPAEQGTGGAGPRRRVRRSDPAAWVRRGRHGPGRGHRRQSRAGTGGAAGRRRPAQRARRQRRPIRILQLEERLRRRRVLHPAAAADQGFQIHYGPSNYTPAETDVVSDPARPGHEHLHAGHVGKTTDDLLLQARVPDAPRVASPDRERRRRRLDPRHRAAAGRLAEHDQGQSDRRDAAGERRHRHAARRRVRADVEPPPLQSDAEPLLRKRGSTSGTSTRPR